MSILPTWPIAGASLVGGVIVGGVALHLWHADTISDLEVTIANMKTSQAQDVATQYKFAADNLAAASTKITDAANAGQTSFASLNTKLDAIDRRYRNAKPVAPLPVDCKPGAERVRRLSEGAAAVDAAISR